MQFAVPGRSPGGRPSEADEAWCLGVIVLFAATIATAVSFKNFLHLPPALGMMLGLGYLQVSAGSSAPGNAKNDNDMVLNSFQQIARVEWDTLLFFFGIIFAVGGLGVLGYLDMTSQFFYGDLGPDRGERRHRGPVGHRR